MMIQTPSFVRPGDHDHERLTGTSYADNIIREIFPDVAKSLSILGRFYPCRGISSTIPGQKRALLSEPPI